MSKQAGAKVETKVRSKPIATSIKASRSRDKDRDRISSRSKFSSFSSSRLSLRVSNGYGYKPIALISYRASCSSSS